ncbi:hypothetical protein BT96DRAFT_959739 [Gymnopus androsaceus JB14]|uniref:Uncharacterized protein n=1 Tax=Gymnopus androsaceus JB14 TaxID=1447944 RepID=A0A6A4H061_9AGAR|nr:hypothetical protein BT96DRAFT_959739 [Gymnopus androsaceus JB14]
MCAALVLSFLFAQILPLDSSIQSFGLKNSDVTTGSFRQKNPPWIHSQDAVRLLNPAVAVKLYNAAIQSSLNSVPPRFDCMFIDVNLRIQILDQLSDLREENCLIVWSDNTNIIIEACKEIKTKLLKLVWDRRRKPLSHASSAPTSLYLMTKSSCLSMLYRSEEALNEKAGNMSDSNEQDEPKEDVYGLRAISVSEKGRKERNVQLNSCIYNGLGAGLAIYFGITLVASLLREWRLDGNVTRFVFVFFVPFNIAISLFCSSLLQTFFGPMAQFHKNSKYYSAVKPVPSPEVDNDLPHVTIQLPVYKESLKLTIAPNVFSLKKAMQTYAHQGGTSLIFICDDGLQALSEEDRNECINFYATHNIGYTARPPHSNDPDGFKHAGRFKKASNMNYGLALSLKLEKHLTALEAQGKTTNWALKLAIDEIYAENDNNFFSAAGYYLRALDAVTVVPEDCFRDAAREMAELPEVAIIQHDSDVMQVVFHYFENGEYLISDVQTAKVAPFVGHNAFLRWSAVQDASFVDPADGKVKQWSEAHVSEDFDMALRLIKKGYVVQWATYSAGRFKEGVSLTVLDEVARWQKYAYRPFSKQLRTFVMSNAPVHYKLNALGYMFSYYGLAVRPPATFINYLVLSLASTIDAFYLGSFQIFLACIIVYQVAGNVSTSFASLLVNIKWLPFFFFFFGGLGVHVFTALSAHMFSYNMTWGATAKEVEKSTSRIFKTFWFSLLVSLLFLATLIVFNLTHVLPVWLVDSIVLNPWLMIFSY